MTVKELLSDEQRSKLVELRRLRREMLVVLGDSYLAFRTDRQRFRAARQQLAVARTGVEEINDKIASMVREFVKDKDVPAGATLDIDDLE
jgi:hypothetical protein